MFDQISPTYDFVNRVLSLGQDLRWRKKVVSFIPLKPHLKILDLATGTGDQMVALYKAGLSIQQAVGIDLAEEMLKIAAKKLHRYPTAELRVADAEKLPFASEQFDAVTFSFGIRNVCNPSRALEQIHRILKKRGRCLILEFSMPKPWIRPFFLFYLRKILPRMGALLSNNGSAYQYLNRTIETFPSGEAFLTLMKKGGFTHLKQIPMNLGSVSLYIGEKP